MAGEPVVPTGKGVVWYVQGEDGEFRPMECDDLGQIKVRSDEQLGELRSLVNQGITRRYHAHTINQTQVQSWLDANLPAGVAALTDLPGQNVLLITYEFEAI